uniref:Uncharacterized protein n=1 Tax=Panagrolaimus sp. ES5 TaxID=591445 RepID=A0AC34FJ51_9BILA
MEEEIPQITVAFEIDENTPEIFKEIYKINVAAVEKKFVQTIQSQNEMIKNLKSNIEIMEKIIASHGNLKGKNSEQKKFIKKQKDDIRNLKEKLQEADERLAVLENEIAKREDHSFVLNEENINLQEKFKKQLNVLAQLTTDYKKITQAQIAKLEDEKSALQEQVAKKNQMIELMKDKITELEDEVNELRNEIDRLKINNAERREKEHDFVGCDRFSNGYGSQTSENEYDPSEDVDTRSTASTENDDENSSNESDDEEESESNEEMAPVNNSSTTDTQNFELINNVLYVYSNDGAKEHHYYRNSAKLYYCGRCKNAKSGKSSRAEIINENGREYVRVNNFHPCELNGSMSFRDFENYEIHSNENGQKELVIFETEEKKTCRRFSYCSKSISFYQCKFRNCRITASVCENENGVEYIKAQWPHKDGCQPTEYFESIQEDGFDFRNGQLITFVKENNEYDRSQYYIYKFDVKNYRYQCSKCINLKNSVQARIWLDENGKKYVQLSATHDCQPIHL